MVAFINKKLKDSGFAGMGPIAKGGLPLYVGRWLDSSGKIRPSPSVKGLLFNTKTWQGAF